MDHKPTRAMKAAAKAGIKKHESGDIKLSDKHEQLGRKIASGAKLSSGLIQDLSGYHGNCPGGAACMALGGPPAHAWADAKATNLAEMDIAITLSEIDDLVDREEDVMVELFSGSHEGETFAEDKEAGVIWAPILRSGQHAMRPGPGGTKLRVPLTVVAGKSEDPTKEIGLLNLKEAFDAGAVQHVTIPKGHPKDDEEMMLKNTGYIKSLKIVESKKVPGQMVLMGAHEFRDADVKDRIEKGLIANRSCGILYNHVNTETGETFEQALEHVALTQKPWIRGMAAYGTDAAVDLSEVERYSFEMFDDEDGIDEPLSLADPKLQQTKTGTVGVVVPDKLELDVQVVWDTGMGMMNQREQIMTILQGMKKVTPGADSYGPPYYNVNDIMVGKALITAD
jgi:hypothetical protein